MPPPNRARAKSSTSSIIRAMRLPLVTMRAAASSAALSSVRRCSKRADASIALKGLRKS